MGDKKIIFMKDKNGVQLAAELLTILKIDGIEYAVYSIDNDVNVSNIYVARIIKDLNDNDNIVTIENDEEKKKVFHVVNKMIIEG